MLLPITDLTDYTIQATDGDIGTIDDLYFHTYPDNWRVRYLVVNLGNWLSRQQVLLNPAVVTAIDTEKQQVVVALNRQQIKDSPDILSDMPISREKELMLHHHYQWQPYWTGHPTESMTFGGSTITQELPGHAVSSRMPEGNGQNENDAVATDPAFQNPLRSTNAVTGYYIKAIDDDIGHVEDFVVDTDNWLIRYLVIDTRNWLPGREVLIATDWVQGIDWQHSEVSVGLTKEGVENSPEYDPERLDRAYEASLYAHYEQPVPW